MTMVFRSQMMLMQAHFCSKSNQFSGILGFSKNEVQNTAIGIAVLCIGIYEYRLQPNKIKAFRNRYSIGIAYGGINLGVGMLVLPLLYRGIPNTAPQYGHFCTGFTSIKFEVVFIRSRSVIIPTGRTCHQNQVGLV